MNCENIKNLSLTGSLFGVSSALAAQSAMWLGSTVITVGALPALGFGFAVGSITSIAGTIFEKFKVFHNPWLQIAASTTLGSTLTYGLYVGATTLGFIATPISIPTALILTITGTAAIILFHIINKCCDKINLEKNKNKESNESKVPLEEIKIVPENFKPEVSNKMNETLS